MINAQTSPRAVLLIIGGGIAAFKSLLLIRLLQRDGISVTCVLTKAGAEFVTPLSVAALSGNHCYTDLFSLTDELAMGHIELSRAADLIVVAPATADLLAKAASGLAGDLAATVLLATDKPVLYAPAMNVRMWEHPATRRNVAQLRADGARFVGPDDGEMACGEYGPGRMAEPEAVAAAIRVATHPLVPGGLAGRHVLVTAGPTYEPLDPVRYIANRSSGKQGYALAEACAAMGARVTLISGPTMLPAPAGVTVRRVETARDMFAATQGALPADVAILCAAVADYRPAVETPHKIKKERGGLTAISLAENPDILQAIAAPGPRRPQLVVGFAAETDNVESHAEAKRRRKGCDWIVANDVSPATGVMGGDRNRVLIVRADGVEHWDDLPKTEVAMRLATRIAGALTPAV